MNTTLQYIKDELDGLYPNTEIEGFARIIIETVCAWDYSEQILKKDEIIPESDIEKIKAIVSRLKKFEPIQYILGETEFFGLKMKVNPSVLIPRPETEELVDWILKSDLKNNPNILDIGTGSGCIALAIKKNMPNSNVSAVDVSEEAIRVAKMNALNNNLDIKFIIDDILNPKNSSFHKYNLIASNPPYVRELEKKQMQNNVLNFEPDLALFVDNHDPLIFYRAIAEFAKSHLSDKGILFLEINEYLGEEMVRLLEDFSFCDIEIRKDINGKDRMLCCTKNS